MTNDVCIDSSRSPEKVVVADLHKSFGTHEVLKGVSLSARAGDVISVLGSSGSGKSTLLRCMNLLEHPSAGRIFVNQTEIRMKQDRTGTLRPVDKHQLRRIRSKLAMVFQHFNLWPHMTVLENVIHAPVHVLGLGRREAEEYGRANLDKVGLGVDIAGRYPAHLSGGQQQRVAIARALTMDPDVLLFDEPTSALDPELVSEVLKVMQKLAAEGRTMIVVTHEMNFARNVSSEIIFLHEGRIEEQGKPADLFANSASSRLRRFLSAA
ncbi:MULTISPECIES: ATP-binding cassette domain-containing protein [Caballeronia]|uniref:ABC transporter ATP-binding protein n=1 Tax=Caballeronia TaxID=1827195 RepID=UPI00025BB0EA|nr:MULTISPECIES: ATP-binding cassette domain-containing protein [Caballeronia]EKS70902.1 polar amino acid transporter ATP-binding protein [Burkholderia sp. SJ98]MDR5788808.1 ATP-binding cassette domain-containing protein [Caballeronia sp. LP003]